MAESEVVKLAREYRRELEANETKALQEMARAWTRMEREIFAEYEALAIAVQDRRDAGEPVPQQYIYSMQRWNRMAAQVMEMRRKYDTKAAEIMTKASRNNAILGLSGSKAVITESKPSDPDWNRINEAAVINMVGFTRDGTPLYTKLEETFDEMTPAIMDALVTQSALGKGYKAVAQAMADAAGMSFERSALIARTEMARAYRVAQMAQYSASNVVKKVFRLAYKPTACFACLMMDGEEITGGEFEDHPRGKCTSIVMTTGGIMPTWQTGREWLEEQSEEDQRRIMGAGRFELWKDTGMDPRQMVWIKPNATWGGAPAIRSVEELKQEAELKRKITKPLDTYAQKRIIITNTENTDWPGIQAGESKGIMKAELTGTEKQVKWAEEIISEAERIAAMCREAKLRMRANRSAEKITINLEKLRTISDAAFIIEHRAKLPTFGKFSPDAPEDLLTPVISGAGSLLAEFIEMAELHKKTNEVK